MTANYRVPAPLDEIRNAITGKEINFLNLLTEETLLIHFIHSTALLLSFHPRFFRCHLSERQTQKQNAFSKEMTEMTRGFSVLDVKQEGPALLFSLKKEQEELTLVAEFSLKRKNLLLLQGETIKLSMRSSTKGSYKPPSWILPTFDENPLSKELDKTFQFLEEKEALLEHAKMRMLALKKIEANLEASRKRCLDWQMKEKEALLLKAHIYQVVKGQKAIDVTDWETGRTITISLMGRDREESLKKAFQSAKRLKHGLEELESKSLVIALSIKETKELIEAISDASSLRELSSFKSLYKNIGKEAGRSRAPREKLPYREYLSQGGLHILVGKSRQDNDQLTFKVASPHDFWLHASDFAGSHVVIRTKKQEELDAKTIEEAAHLAIEFSQAKGKSAADVVVTRQKHLRRIKGKPGQVMIREKKVIRIVFDKRVLDAVLKRKPQK
ncbi:NFACT RNA binding domain-containing protein [Estrella lausannensis]|uniref:NFACT RNA-binding domain-containing protein n=1 Tax=Estrella lausannensis TaxID=483423 RepID=A0A0H5DMT9_9BACT|nr:NFACT RNA binding domain-containing protein [Estrella lausannensis]CRX37476.1 hypothetical protein ELAC_0114 [Estrella lausannensis]